MGSEMMQGWIKLHRALLDKPIWRQSSPEQKTILITILLMANHKPIEWEWQGEKITLKQGQFVASVETIKERAGNGVSTQNVRTALKRFEKFGFLTNEPTNRATLITVENYALYQGAIDEPNEQTNKQLTSDQQATNKRLTNLHYIKNNKNNKNNIYIQPALGEFENVLITEEELEKLKERFPYDWEDRVERLSEYIQSKGKRYKSHYATILAWARKDADRCKADSKEGRLDWIDDI